MPECHGHRDRDHLCQVLYYSRVDVAVLFTYAASNVRGCAYNAPSLLTTCSILPGSGTASFPRRRLVRLHQEQCDGALVLLSRVCFSSHFSKPGLQSRSQYHSCTAGYIPALKGRCNDGTSSGATGLHCQEITSPQHDNTQHFITTLIIGCMFGWNLLYSRCPRNCHLGYSRGLVLPRYPREGSEPTASLSQPTMEYSSTRTESAVFFLEKIIWTRLGREVG